MPIDSEYRRKAQKGEVTVGWGNLNGGASKDGAAASVNLARGTALHRWNSVPQSRAAGTSPIPQMVCCCAMPKGVQLRGQVGAEIQPPSPGQATSLGTGCIIGQEEGEPFS